MDQQTPPELLEYESIPKPAPNWLDRKPNSWAVTVTLLLALFIATISLLAWKDRQLFELLLLQKTEMMTSKGFFNLFSSLFIHADARHLISNLFLGSFLVFFLFGYFGSGLVPVAAIFMGALINFITLLTMPENSSLLGFSGVVFWMGGCWLTLYFLIMKRISISHRILRVVTVGLMIFFPTEAFDPSVSYTAHFLGFLTGVLFALIYYMKSPQKWILESTETRWRASAIKD